MGTYSIKDLERLSGVKAHTIRIWEQRYNLLKPIRSETNIRAYDDLELKKLLRLNILYNNGLKISKIADLTDKQITQKIEELLRTERPENNVIESLTISMIDMDEGKFDHVLTDYIQQYGFDEFMIKVVYPFLERIGVLWMTNVIIPAQEHFITNLVRQKIIAAIDELGPAKNGQGKTCIAFLNESEMHELGLLYYSYQLRKNGFKVIYLGQMVPFEDVVSAMEAHEPEYVLTSFVNQTKSGWVDSYLENLLKQNATVEVLASGIQMASVTLENNRVHKFSHVNELISFVKGV